MGVCRWYKPLMLACCFIVPTLVPWYMWGESLWTAYFLAGVLRYTLGLNATWLVNSAAHMWGNKPYDRTINPTQNLGVSFSAVGEGFHNYHHVFPHDYSTSEYGWHFNITTMFIDFMAFLGLAYDRRRIPSSVIMKRKARTGDGTDWLVRICLEGLVKYLLVCCGYDMLPKLCVINIWEKKFLIYGEGMLVCAGYWWIGWRGIEWMCCFDNNQHLSFPLLSEFCFFCFSHIVLLLQQ